MADKPINPIVELTEDEASRIIASWLGEDRAVRRLRRLTGGCVYTVLEAEFEGDESPVVLKVSHRVGERGIEAEHNVLAYFRAHTEFPVPEPYACDLSGELVPYSWLAMERIEGDNLGDARSRLTETDMTRIQLRLGEAVAKLHRHTRAAGYGHLLSDSPEPSWAEHFRGRIEAEKEGAWQTGLMAAEDLPACERIIEAIPHHLDRETAPTLVHGDIWATNIMVGGDPRSMQITGFLDPGGIFADPEYELAYLQIWHTADEGFFAAYTAHHEIGEDYELRRLFYWLNTLLLHVRAFGTDDYAQAATDLIRRLGEALS